MRGPGLFDLQVNGYAGVDFNDTSVTADAIDHAFSAMLQGGVTHCLPTIITAAEPDLGARLGVLDRAIAASRLGPGMAPGFHLEGPFLNPGQGYSGCHPPGAMVVPDSDLIGRLQAGLSRPILLVTLAPELPGAERFIRWARGRGMVVALGHTAATSEEVARAAEAGASLVTHLGNGLAPVLPKFDNPLMAQLAEDRLHASFIADGIHVPMRVLKVMVRAKGVGRSILVTDATAAAAAPPGVYGFAGMRVEGREDGSVRDAETGRLAGSALTLEMAVRNVVGAGIATREEALAMASGNPRTLLAPALQAFWDSA